MEAFTILLALMLVLVGLGLGTTMQVNQLKTAMRQPKALVIGMVCQYGLMPVFAYALCSAFNLDKGTALGVILVGSCPGGSTSNLFTYWSGGNVALSVTMSAASTLAAFAMMPLCIYVYAQQAYGTDADIPWAQLFISLMLCIVPCCLGVFLRHKNTERRYRGKFVWEWVEKLGSAAGGIFLLVAVIIGCADNEALFNDASASLWTVTGLMEPLGALAGFAAAAAVGLSRRDGCTVALETGVQNSTLAIAIVELSFRKGSERDVVMRGPLAYSLFYLVHSVWLVLLFRRVIGPPAEETEGKALPDSVKKIAGGTGKPAVDPRSRV